MSYVLLSLFLFSCTASYITFQWMYTSWFRSGRVGKVSYAYLTIWVFVSICLGIMVKMNMWGTL